MIGRKGTSIEAAVKRRINIFPPSRIYSETPPNLQNGNFLDPSKVSLPTESEYHYKNASITISFDKNIL
jgi:hypothetical protein